MTDGCYLYEGERLVFEGEGWGIIVDDGFKNRTYSEGFVYGTHEVCTIPYEPNYQLGSDEYSYGENCWSPRHNEGFDVEGAAVCAICEVAVPEGVQALIFMQAWGDSGKVRTETLTHR